MNSSPNKHCVFELFGQGFSNDTKVLDEILVVSGQTKKNVKLVNKLMSRPISYSLNF